MTPASGDLPPLRSNTLSWVGVVRLGLVQAGIGAVVVLATSTLARLMTVELALPALAPGALVALHYLVQLARPGLGHTSDRAGRRTAYVVGGMALTALGGVAAAGGVALWPALPALAVALLLAGFLALGLGMSGCGTALFALLAERTAPERRGPAATLMWILMMVGFIASAGVAGAALKPYSGVRLVEVSGGVGLVAILLAIAGVAGLERPGHTGGAPAPLPSARPGFRAALQAVWDEPHTRRFAGVIFLAILANAGQELVLEPLAGAVFGLSPGASTQLMGMQRGGALIGMVAFGILSGATRGRLFSPAGAVAAGCGAAALALLALAAGALRTHGFPLGGVVFTLGVADGVFATAAIGAMMAGANGADGRTGLRMGVWGAAQAIANAAGGLLATGALQLGRGLWTGGEAFLPTLGLQAALFALAAVLTLRLTGRAAGRAASPRTRLAQPA